MHNETAEELQAIRESPEYDQWRDAVLDRDGHCCQICGNKRELHAHHMQTFYDYPALRLVLQNALTLCARCHAIIHGKTYLGLLPTYAERVIAEARKMVMDAFIRFTGGSDG